GSRKFALLHCWRKGQSLFLWFGVESFFERGTHRQEAIRMRQLNGCLAVLSACLVLAQCGCGGKDRPVKLEGLVTLDGEPVEGAIVSFLPDEGAGRFAHALTAKDGSFRLTTYK